MVAMGVCRDHGYFDGGHEEQNIEEWIAEVEIRIKELCIYEDYSRILFTHQRIGGFNPRMVLSLYEEIQCSWKPLRKALRDKYGAKPQNSKDSIDTRMNSGMDYYDFGDDDYVCDDASEYEDNDDADIVYAPSISLISMDDYGDDMHMSYESCEDSSCSNDGSDDGGDVVYLPIVHRKLMNASGWSYEMGILVC